MLAIRARLHDASREGNRLEALAAALDLSEVPKRIECFDISHTGGEAAVGACVVFADGRMLKSEYRRYNVTGVTPGDDYASMRQVLTRRYEKVAAGQGARPDLILIDGGKGQLGVASEVLNDVGLADLPALGVAKGEARTPGMEELIFPDARPPLHLGPEHPALLLIQEIRDEAHRFAVGGHRAKRAKVRRSSTLEGIAGIGPVRRKQLLAQFGGLQGVLAATVEDLCRVEGINRTIAERLYQRLH
jgi:excinuclease ABC subunit C